MTGDRPSSSIPGRPILGSESLPIASEPCARLLIRRLAQQTALAEFAQSALDATELEPLQAEARALVHRVAPTVGSTLVEALPGADADDAVFAASVAGMLGAASGKLDAAEARDHAALHDPLTGLANRSLILDHLHLALARATRQGTLTAVLFLDLDQFKRVNDTLGHAAGDELLIRVARRLGRAVRPSDTLGRWGGDEFVVICEDLERVSDGSAIVHRVAAAFDLPFEVNGTLFSVGASIGVALSGGGGDQPAALIHGADLAMYRAKRGGADQERAGNEVPVFPAGEWRPKLERVTGRLYDLLAAIEVDESAAPR
jgi:diguanylate cyclase (GGDEF)-like protein